MAKQDDYTRITLRIPTHLHEFLVQFVAGKAKSLNAEIVERLESSVQAQSHDNPFLRLAANVDRELLRRAANEIEYIVDDMDTVLGPLDKDAWRKGAYSYLEEPVWGRSENPFRMGTPQYSSWIAGRAFSVAGELKRTIRETEEPSDELASEG